MVVPNRNSNPNILSSQYAVKEPGTAFTTLNFHLKLQTGPVSKSVTLHQAKRLCSDKHSSLLVMFVSHEENLVL